MRRPLPSPATLIALLALFVALGTGAYAATQLPKNSVRSKQIKNGQVSTKDLKDGSATGTDVKDGSLTGVDVADGSLSGADVTDDSLSGADIDESSLQVKSEVMPISARVPAGTVATPLYSASGLSVALDCGAGGSATISRTNVNGFFAEEGRSFSSLPNVLNEGTASNASVISMAANSHIDDHLTFRRSSDGAVVTADLVLVTTDSQVGTDCLAMGNAFASRGG